VCETNKTELNTLDEAEMSITGVAVEKVGFSEKSQKSGDRKCPGDLGKSFKELPDAKQFLRHRSERVFQQPKDFSTVICDGGPELRKSRRTIPFGSSLLSLLHSLQIEGGTKDHPVSDEVDDGAAMVAISVVDTQIAITRL